TVLCFDALLQLVSRMDLQFEWDETFILTVLFCAVCWVLLVAIAIAAMDLLVLALVGVVVAIWCPLAAMDYLVLVYLSLVWPAPYVTQGLAYREYAWKHGASDGKQKPIVCYKV
ncbi:hypothetical protein IFM89_025757, partial [Coptis chinensis]